MQAAMTAQLVADALMMAIWRRGRPHALLHHSDQGSQGELNRSSQHLEIGGCDDQSKTSFGTICAPAIAVARSTTCSEAG
jgi:putative transposase